MNLVRDFEVEGGEAAFVLAQRFAIEIDASEVIGSAEVDENAGVFALVVRK